MKDLRGFENLGGLILSGRVKDLRGFGNLGGLILPKKDPERIFC
ncbi:Uncharacterized protein dnm_072860 [Desulfonema magnum]|uniref:Uncharacterized protein n=1 Tax=Desulfonema magnum TaxID=45655 RepID=A0A975BTK1_9BACT|nr:Uncharacterized protein dnm_072860 [Desulfonema magnum]